MEDTVITSFNYLAGAVGFEPTVHRIKTCCLTTWPRPNILITIYIKQFTGSRNILIYFKNFIGWIFVFYKLEIIVVIVVKKI